MQADTGISNESSSILQVTIQKYFNWEDFFLDLEYFIVSYVYVSTRRVAWGPEAEPDH